MSSRLLRASGWILAGTLLVGADWQSCQRDLDKLRTRAGEASNRAASTRAEGASLETKKRELDDCRASSRDGCRAQSDTYEGASKQFDAAKSNLDSALDDVDSSVRATNRSCGYSVSTTSQSSSSSDPICWLLQRSKGHVSTERLMETCKKVGKSDEQCRVCLQ
jgi:chromosome segregation ATPase